MICLYLEALTCRIAAVRAHAFPTTLPVRSLSGRTGSVDAGTDRGAVDGNVRVWSSKPEARPKVCPFSPAGLRHSQDSPLSSSLTRRTAASQEEFCGHTRGMYRSMASLFTLIEFFVVIEKKKAEGRPVKYVMISGT